MSSSIYNVFGYTIPSTFNINVRCYCFFCSNASRTIDGNQFLDDQNYSENDLWINELALFLFTIFFFVVAYIILRLIKKDK